MKKLITLVLIVLTVLMLLCACEDGKTVTKTYVNDALHVIVEYSDGTSDDLGYVGTVD